VEENVFAIFLCDKTEAFTCIIEFYCTGTHTLYSAFH
jgi:hypothetical protein